ncbi:sialidase family protein [Aquincola sp. MAHUQ-54]|uniref:Sialidase family protein n=1 Tax=Aquincola agrisoli TaxID=3119538 RepID=A0AAW9QCQ7_9BURK
MIALAALSACDDDGLNGIDGSNGISALLKTTAEASSSYCPSGGTRIESGPDTNTNGTLEAGEVTGTQYVCNGDTPARPLTAMAAEPAGAHCATGGTRITAGADANGNGTLDAAEVSSTAYVCTGAVGATGTTGATGATGSDGYTHLVALAVEPLGSASCTYGGTRITSGLDTDRNGSLAAGEVAATSYVCNGAGVTWSNVVSDTSVQMASHMGYIASNTTTEVAFSLPVSPAIGDIVRVKGGLGVGWKITQAAGQSIDLGDLRTWSSLSGQAWTELPVQIGVGWETFVASSSSGQTVAAVTRWLTDVGVSKDGGATWALTTLGPNVRDVAVSPNGKVMYVSTLDPANGMYVSSDEGATWAARTLLTDVIDAAAYTNGVVAIGTLGGITAPYRSTDGGVSWTSLLPTGAPPSACWRSIAVSADGQHIAIGGNGNGSCSAIPVFVSHDAGVSWIASDATNGPPQNRIQMVAISGSGNTVVVGSSDGGIGLRVSTDGGRTYRQSTITDGLYPELTGKIALSADGRRMVAPATSSRVYTSNNTGYTWSVQTVARGAVSAAGSSTLDAVYYATPRGVDGGYVFKSESVLSSVSGTTGGVGGQVSGTSGDALELQHLGSGVWSVLGGVSNLLVVR